MNSSDILDIIGETPEKYIFDAVSAYNAESAVKHKPALKRFALIAAIIAALMLLMGSAVVCVMKMLDFNIGTFYQKHPVLDEYMQYQGEETVTQQVLAVSGLKDSPAFRASQEWYAFVQNYDPDWKIYDSVIQNLPDFPEEYTEYGLYTQAMKEKVDEILDKYRLKPTGATLEFRTVKNLCTALGIEKTMTTSNGVGMRANGGGCWSNGNFYLNFNITLPEDNKAVLSQTMGDIWWYRKDCFSTDFIFRDLDAGWKEWNYSTDSGHRALIVRSSSDWRGWIIFAREEGMLVARVETTKYQGYNVDGRTWYDTAYMTDRQMEQVADAVDSVIHPRLVTVEDADNQAPVCADATQNGYTVEVKEVNATGRELAVKLDITAPQECVISKTVRKGYEDEAFNLQTLNLRTLTPAQGNNQSAAIKSTQALIPVGDKDDLDYTQTFVIKAMAATEQDEPFTHGSKWNLHLEDLIHGYWNGVDMTYETLADGEWLFEITVP